MKKTHRKIYAKGLGGPYIHINRPLTKNNYYSFKEIIQKSLNIELENWNKYDVTVHVDITDGSIKIKVVLGAGLALFNIVGVYGSYRSGIDYIVDDIRNISSSVIEHVIADENIDQEEIIYKARRLGIPGKIQRYLQKIDRLDDTDVNHDQRSILVSELKDELNDILTVLEHDEDRNQLIEETPAIIKERVSHILPQPIPGQLDLRYEVSQDYPTAWSVDLHVEDRDDNNDHQPTLPESNIQRPELPPPRNENEE